MDRYYCEELRPADVISLPDDQTHHALHVMRLRDGDKVELFDGRGHLAAAQAIVQKRRIQFEIVGKISTSPPPPFELQIATAIPKADRADQLVEAASQLGVHTLSWINCQRSVVKCDDKGGKMVKWRRIALESAKQCRRNWLMNIESPVPLSELIARCKMPMLFADPQSSMHLTAWIKPDTPVIRSTIFVGPEGGFSPDEIQAFQNCGGQAVSLGVNILRIETAVATAAAIMGKLLMVPLS